ncbi:hypothetical protein CARUB_v10014675mg [Capsella rubella]|uniref:Uncharacterized protein n=1 Tax=Capsella rubella TaxID=81985 RepID=R0HP32_9BRAS|nr:uncharacterized protein LOC17892181 [Capsella rubella]EOA31489.1 hypothetical protein CARUB_v10014675mg [Capsella rubella]
MAEYYNCLPMKMKKRKDIDRVNNDFSDFSLSSPANKIRRLDLDLPPIMEEDEIKSVSSVNEERAIVLYKPLRYHHQRCSGDFFVDSDFVSGLKHRILHDVVVADDLCDDDDDEKSKQKAVVRWDSSSKFQSFEEPPAPEITELDGEDEMMEESAMDVEEASLSQQQLQLAGGLHQWQQQQLHCMVPQLPQTKSTPISWYR